MINVTRTYQVLMYPSERNMVMEMFQPSKSQGLLQPLKALKSGLLARHRVVGASRGKSVRKLCKINK